MTWVDDAVLLHVQQVARGSMTFEILTSRYGRQICSAKVGGEQQRALLPGARFSVEHAGDGPNQTPLVEIENIVGGIAEDDATATGPVVWVAMREILREFLPLLAPAKGVYQATQEVLDALGQPGNRWALAYFRWELSVLENLDHVSRLGHCRSVFNSGEVIYFAPRRGTAVTREEAGAFLDKVIPVPGFLLGKRDASATELRQAEELLTQIFESTAMEEAALDEMPESREIVIKRSKGIRAVPKPPPTPKKGLTEDDYRRRLLSLRPLQVVDSSASSS